MSIGCVVMRQARPGAIGAVPQRVVGWRVHLAATLIATLAVTGCSGSRASEDSASSSTTVPVAPGVPVDAQPGPFRIGPAPAYAAIGTTDPTIYEAPRGNAAITAVFPVKLPWGSPTSFLVRQAYRDAADRTWFEVFLPRRPNGSTGWVRGDQVRPRPMLHQVDVDLSARMVRLLRDGRTVRSWPVGIGRQATPTPTGSFYVTVKLRPPQISAVYGAWALGISGYSDVLDQFGTGDGQIALHGTTDPGDLGREVSSGCLRLDNGAIASLARMLPLGTPVTIRK
jgi:lipoprotein-anchoring transpeptidase ErfK/SrfK